MKIEERAKLLLRMRTINKTTLQKKNSVTFKLVKLEHAPLAF